MQQHYSAAREALRTAREQLTGPITGTAGGRLELDRLLDIETQLPQS